MKWTHDQESIIDFAGKSDLLVSAAAGSGKTAVMTERVRRRSVSGQGDISRMLIMTFTDYAAQNMRDRIERSFRQALEENISEKGSSIERERLEQQIMLLQEAQISTIHSFCWQIIQTWSGELTNSQNEPLLEAGFGVLDDTRRQMLIEQSVDEVLSTLYELLLAQEQKDEKEAADGRKLSGRIPDHEADIFPFCLSGEEITLAEWLSDFARLYDSLTGKRSDTELRDSLMSTLSRLRSLPDYAEWCRHQLDNYAAKAVDFARSTEYEHYMALLMDLLVRAEEGLDELRSLPYFDHLMSTEVSGVEEPRFSNCLKSQLEGISRLRSLIDDSDPDKWDRIYNLALTIDSSYLLAKRTTEKREFMNIYNSRVAPLMHLLTGSPAADKFENFYMEMPLHLFSVPMGVLEHDMTAMHRILARFFETVLLIDNAYMRLKIEEKAIDFSDFEHFALRLLRIPEIRDSYRDRFQEIYLDEYQDTNNIQDSIISQIADNNVFMVGDIKQSIYRFRYANPALFVDKANTYVHDPAQGRLMRLNQNFRSEPAIIDGVNRFFSSFLTEESGEIEYTKGHQLTAGREAENDAQLRLMIVNVKENQLTDSVKSEEIREDDNTAIESLATIREIRKLVDSGKCGYGDIAILARTRSICSVYYKQLTDHSIPVTAAGERDFLDSPELRLMESLINLLDNSQQDIPLAAIMRSGIAGDPFNEEELMLIRAADKERLKLADADGHFYASVASYAASGPDIQLKQRVGAFLATIETWREYESFMSISELIGLIYEESGVLDRVSRLPSGQERVHDLELFREWADSFERSRQRGLYSFALYIRKIREKKLRETGFDNVSSVENAVQIMTVHGSKGLEFPVVFLVGAGQDMEPDPSANKITVSENGGITAMAMDPDRLERHMTALHYMNELAAIHASRAESYRLLYVAMTRAETRLYISGRVAVRADKGSESMRKLLASYIDNGRQLPIPAQITAAAKSWLQLLLLSLASEDDLDPLAWFEEKGIDSGCMNQHNQYYDLVWFESDWLRSEVYPLSFVSMDPNRSDYKAEEIYVEPDQKLINIWHNRLFTKYKYSQALEYPAKMTVSGLKRLQDQIIASDQNMTESQTEPSDIGDKIAVINEGKREMSLELRQATESGSLSKLKGAELGSMLHSLFQFLDLTRLDGIDDEAEIRKQIESMVSRRIINSRNLKQALEWSRPLMDFARSDLAGTMRKLEMEGRPVYREMPFTMAVNPDDIDKNIEKAKAVAVAPEQDFTLVQGMIDCWFEDEKGITVVDFKSDHLNCKPEDYKAEMIKRYALQLDYYSEAITKATGRRPYRRVIWLIRYSEAIVI